MPWPIIVNINLPVHIGLMVLVSSEVMNEDRLEDRA